MLFIVLLL